MRGSVLPSHLRALALRPFDTLPPLSPRASLLVAAAHLAGLAAVARLAHWPLPLLLAALALICLPALLRRRFHLALLAPLGLLYGVTALRALVAVVAHSTGYTSGPFYVPNPFAPWLQFGWTAAAVAAWCAAILTVWLAPAGRRAWLLAAALGAGASGWAGALYFRLAPAGVTGSDPYAYVQMALDLAAHGTPLHRFPLAALAFDLHLPVYPALHVGYRLPFDGWSATVWPPGFSALLAGAYRLFGEGGLYHLNPALGLLSLALTFAFTAQAAPFPDRGRRAAAGALAAALLATSHEQAVRLAVPLADVAAQFLSLLALALALLARRRGKGRRAQAGLALVAGLAFGLAYDVRYTQLLLAPAFLYLALASPSPLHPPHLPLTPCRPRPRWRFLLPFCGAALLIALPDLAYHRLAFGSPFRVGSEELALFALRNVGPGLARLAGVLFSPREFGLWLPLILLGGWALPRRAALALALGLGPLVLFHLPYEFLRPRDLLTLWPMLAALAGIGALSLFSRVERFPWSRPLALALGFALLGGRWSALRSLPQGFYTFGGLLPGQRAALVRLVALTPPQAVIAGSLNSGAVELYAGRQTVRPGAILQPGRGWTESEWLTFVAALLGQGRPVYLLADSVEMAAPLRAVQRLYRVEHVADLGLPYYYHGGGSENLDVPLYRVIP